MSKQTTEKYTTTTTTKTMTIKRQHQQQETKRSVRYVEITTNDNDYKHPYNSEMLKILAHFNFLTK